MSEGGSPPSWQPDWKGVPEDCVGELLRLAEAHLQGTVSLGVSSDQRSAALCGVFGAGGFALLTVAATIFAGAHAYVAAQTGAVATGALLLWASYLCA